DGRLVDWVADAAHFTAGVYRLRFATAAYFQSLGAPCFFPEVQILFQVDDPRGHWHVPLLLSPYGHTTYRRPRQSQRREFLLDERCRDLHSLPQRGDCP